MENRKQETLEEAAEKWLNKDGFNIYNHYDTRPSFIAGAKWQQERSYSEEIVDILDNVRYWETCPNSYKVIIERFIEQFRNK